MGWKDFWMQHLISLSNKALKLEYRVTCETFLMQTDTGAEIHFCSWFNFLGIRQPCWILRTGLIQNISLPKAIWLFIGFDLKLELTYLTKVKDNVPQAKCKDFHGFRAFHCMLEPNGCMSLLYFSYLKEKPKSISQREIRGFMKRTFYYLNTWWCL